MDWYCVKILYQINVHGKPKRKDQFYSDDKKTYYEESMILVQADSFEHAYGLADLAAKDNCNTYTNKYGQKISREAFAYLDCFRADDSLESGTEVYSSIFREKKSLGKESLIKKRYKKCDRKDLHMLRDIKFNRLGQK